MLRLHACDAGTLKGATGEKLTNLICIGIGGSYLGSEFIVESLKTEPNAAKAAEGRTIRHVHANTHMGLAFACRTHSPLHVCMQCCPLLAFRGACSFKRLQRLVVGVYIQLRFRVQYIGVYVHLSCCA